MDVVPVVPPDLIMHRSTKGSLIDWVHDETPDIDVFLSPGESACDLLLDMISHASQESSPA